MEDIKKLLVYFRNALAFSYSWLVLCAVLVSLVGGGENLNTVLLLKILALCAWGSACFVFAFFTKIMKKRGFVFELTIFFALFIPVEVLMFYWMKIFTGAGTVLLWMILGIFVIICYITCIMIDLFVMKKRAKVYTDKLMEYNAKNQAAKN